MPFTPEWMICQTSDFEESAFRENIALTGETVHYHRKQWEYAYVLTMAQGLGLTGPGTRALGIGVLQEPVVDALASLGGTVLATDLAMFDVSATPIFQRRMADPDFPHAQIRGLNGRAITEADRFKTAVSFDYLDILDDAAVQAAGTFDLVWACAVLPHMGSAAAIGKALDNTRRLLRPGGWALHTFDVQFTHKKGQTLNDLHFLSESDVAALYKTYLPPSGWRRHRAARNALRRSRSAEDRDPQVSAEMNRHICAQIGDMAVGSAGIALPAIKEEKP